MRVVFIGPPGCGKSTLVASVFSELKNAGKQVESIHEFVRNDIQAHGPMMSIWEQYRTRQFQKELEDAVPPTIDYVICDSGTLAPYFYAVLYSNPIDARQRLVLQDMYRYLLDDLFLKRYDIVFYLPSIGGVSLNDGTRYQTDDEIKVLNEHMCLIFTKLHRLANVHMVQSGFDHRLEEVMTKILGVHYLTLTAEVGNINLSTGDTVSVGDAIRNY
jgi:nicotinamide riboside kinase